MKILLDECVVQDLRRHLTGHDVFTVGYLHWAGTKNGKLLELAASHGFGVLVTTDQNIPFQAKTAALLVAIVVLVASSNDIEDLLPLVPRLLAALPGLPLHSVTRIGPV